MIAIVKASDDREAFFKKMLDDDFKTNYLKGTLKTVQETKKANMKDGVVIRNKEDRKKMHASDCPCCSGYYDALDLSPDTKAKRIQEVSRHRYVEMPLPKTPEHYWELGFPSSAEQKRRGYIKITSKSPGENTSAAKKLF